MSVEPVSRRNAVSKAVLLFLVLLVTWQLVFLSTATTLSTELFNYLVIAAVLAVFLTLDRQAFSGLGLRRTARWRTYLAVGIILAAIYVSYLVVLGFLFNANSPDGSAQPLIYSIGYGLLSVPYAVTLALLVGFVEETSFRGYILRNLKSSYSARKSIVLSSVLFGLYHLSIPGILSSQTSSSQTFTFWTSFILFVFVGSLFAGSFYLSSQQTIIGTIALHSGTILLQNFTPYTSALANTVGYLFDSIPYIPFILLLFYLRRKGLLGDGFEKSVLD